MESELSRIFQVKVVTKNIVFGSLGTQAKLLLQYDVSFWRKIQIFWSKLLHLSIFLVKQYTSFIYVERMPFCLVNWAFPFMGSRFMQESCKNISCIWGLFAKCNLVYIPKPLRFSLRMIIFLFHDSILEIKSYFHYQLTPAHFYYLVWSDSCGEWSSFGK